MRRWLLILLCTLPLLACGQKGPLRLPDEQPPEAGEQSEQPEQNEDAS